MKITTTAGKEYLDDWVCALKMLLGWDRQRTMDWAKQFERDLNDDMSSLWREHPVFYVALWLIPSRLTSELNDFDKTNLARRLEAAIIFPECGSQPLHKCNWKNAIPRVDAILSEYGEDINSIRRQYEE